MLHDFIALIQRLARSICHCFDRKKKIKKNTLRIARKIDVGKYEEGEGEGRGRKMRAARLIQLRRHIVYPRRHFARACRAFETCALNSAECKQFFNSRQEPLYPMYFPSAVARMRLSERSGRGPLAAETETKSGKPLSAPISLAARSSPERRA